MTAHPPANDNVLTPEPTLIPKETPETAVASQPEEVVTKTVLTDVKETIPPSVIDQLLYLDEMPTDQTQPEATVGVLEVVSGRGSLRVVFLFVNFLSDILFNFTGLKKRRWNECPSSVRCHGFSQRPIDLTLSGHS